MSTPAKTFLNGVRAEFPLLIGVFPFGMIYGALALNAGLSTLASQLMSSIVFAGSSQFVAAQLIHDEAPGFVIVLTIAGSATMWMAVFADMGASLLVVFNGLRLLRK